MMRIHKRFILKSALLLVLLTGLCYGGLLATNVGKVMASTDCTGPNLAYGLPQYKGYFPPNPCDDGAGGTGGYVLGSGLNVNDLGTLESTLNGYRNGSSGAQNKTGADFIILTMLGINGGAHGNSVSDAEYTQWATLIGSQNGSPGGGWITTTTGLSINFNYPLPFPCGTVNSFYQTPEDNDAFFPEQSSSTSSTSCGSSATVASIVFKDGSGREFYAIKRNCGNPVGTLNSLPRATGDINGVDVDSTSGANLGGSFKPSISVNPANAPPQATNAFYFTGLPAGGSDGTTYTAYTVSAPASYTYNGETYTPVRSTFCDSTDHPGCDSGLTTASGAPNVIYSNGATTQQIHLKTNHVINMRWFWKVSSGGGGSTPIACPMQPSSDATKLLVTLPDVASDNNPDTWDLNGTRYYSSPSLPPPPYNLVYTHRYGTSYKIGNVTDSDDSAVSITVAQQPTSGSNQGYLNFTDAVQTYPYDTNNATVPYTETYGYDQTVTTVDADGNSTSSSSSTSDSGMSWSGSTTASLGECYPIHFNVDTVTANNSSLNNYENPTTASLTSTVSVHLWGSQGGSKRSALSVNGLSDAVSYTIRHVDGSTYPLGASTSVNVSCGGGSTIDCPASANPSTSVTSYVGSAQSQFRPGDVVCAAFTISPQKGDTNTDGTIQSGQAGTVAPSGSAGPSNTVCSNPVVNEPYFKVFGGDISAGDAFEVTNGVVGQCVSSVAAANANVYGWNTAGSSAYNPNQYIKNLPDYNDSSSPYYHVSSNAYSGAGAQFSIVAINSITGVASGQNNVNADDPPNNTQGNGLAFANAGTNPAGNIFATSFGKAPACVPDYYADKPGTAPSLSGSIPATADGAYSLSGSTITGGTIGAGKHVVVYATGTVNITGPITFAAGTYAIDNIPSFVLVVKGNINVSNGVTQLDGIYIAQPTDPANPTDGTLSDCLEASAGRTNLWSACSNPLTVNGSFIANKVELLRTSTSDAGSYRENPSIRAALPGESNSLANTYIVDAQQIATCTSGVPDSNGFCGNATYHSGSSGTPGYYGAPWTYGGTYTMQPGDDCYNANCSGCTISGSLETCISGNVETYYWGTYYAGSPGSPSYYSCPSGETLSGTKCKAKITYTCIDGSTPDSSHKCTIHVTPTHASEVFNYSPAFWLSLSLQNASSQNALKYDSVTSLPPVL